MLLVLLEVVKKPRWQLKEKRKYVRIFCLNSIFATIVFFRKLSIVTFAFTWPSIDPINQMFWNKLILFIRFSFISLMKWTKKPLVGDKKIPYHLILDISVYNISQIWICNSWLESSCFVVETNINELHNESWRFGSFDFTPEWL